MKTYEKLVVEPLQCAADGRSEAGFDIEPEAQAAFLQMAEEFETIASEIAGLACSYEAMIRRKRPARRAHEPRNDLGVQCVLASGDEAWTRWTQWTTPVLLEAQTSSVRG